MILWLLLVLLLAPHSLYGETIGSLRYRDPGLFQYDYPGQRSVEAFQADQKSNRVSPSFKPEFRHSDYTSLPQGQPLQQHLLRMGFKFRDFPGSAAPMDNSPQFRPQPGARQSGYPRSSGAAWAGPVPVFRPLGDAERKKSERASGRGVAPVPAFTASYRLNDYGADLSDTIPVGSVFRPIP